MPIPYAVSPRRDAFDRWRGEITPEMQRLLDVVAEVVDSGLSYNSDVYPKVAERFSFTLDGQPVALPVPFSEGNEISREIYSARSELDRQRDAEKERAAFARLALSEGSTVGALRFSALTRIKGIRRGTVRSAEIGKIVITGSSGGRTFNVTMTAVAVEAAQRRAMED